MSRVIDLMDRLSEELNGIFQPTSLWELINTRKISVGLKIPYPETFPRLNADMKFRIKKEKFDAANTKTTLTTLGSASCSSRRTERDCEFQLGDLSHETNAADGDENSNSCCDLKEDAKTIDVENIDDEIL